MDYSICQCRGDLFYAVFIVCVPFPFGVWGRMSNSTVWFPDHCLFIYFSNKGLNFRPRCKEILCTWLAIHMLFIK